MANITLKKKTASNTAETIYPKTKWTQVSEKPSSFNPAPHIHSPADIPILSISKISGLDAELTALQNDVNNIDTKLDNKANAIETELDKKMDKTGVIDGGTW